ncbi:hypothetical protein ULMS_12850 [Patiriisocius marinistellae]|uniref:Secretion system C-terminal sorting domain-containing protein n=2 Tax=Patiriisocius marinistellae TaxID=2494560 RepID=A0A5J4FTG9_9FLAO|nr:hypothetical protein ULMS_12850 [Patiriisocius marinistellae]
MIDAGTHSVEAVVANAEAYFANRDTGRGSGYKQFKRWEYMANRRMNENGYIPTDAQNIAELERYNDYLNETAASRAQLVDNWEELGPFNFNNLSSWSPGLGRVTGFSLASNNVDHIIISSEGGGIWKTLDGGQSWNPLTDMFSNITSYSVTIDPLDSSVYYFGSTNGQIFKSLDAGGTWNAVGSIGNSVVNKILIHPTNTDILYATAEYAGIYRSDDSGNSWTQITGDNRGFDIEFKPGNPDVVYASGNEFHKSIDGGLTFTTTPNLSNDAQMIGVSEDNPDVVYVIQASSGIFGGIFKSTNSGDSFTGLNQGGLNYFGYDVNGQDNSGQAPRDMDIAVNPNNVDEVHIAGIQTWRSLNGGVSFECTSNWLINSAANQGIGYCHADVDIIGFVDSILFVGTDGGFFKAEDTQNLNADYYENISEGLGIRQFYKIGVSQEADVTVVGGSQDNGGSFYTEGTGWREWYGADGMEGFVSNTNSDLFFGMIQNGGLYRSTNQGNSNQGVNTPGGGSGNWVTPLEQDPIEQNTLYVAYKNVIKSTNNGNSWTTISQERIRNIDNLKIAPSNNQIMYFTDNTLLFRTQNGGATDWEDMGTYGGSARSLAVHPTNPNKIAVATNNNNKVFVSNNGGETWESYKKNLPNFSATALIWDDNGQDGLYLGMDYGIYYIDNTLQDWEPYNTNMPNVVINEFDINHTTNTLYAATYGRGLWASPLVEDNLGTRDFISQNQVVLYPNPARGSVLLKLPFNAEADVEIYDVNGKLMINLKDLFISSETELNINKLVQGVYFVRITTSKGTVTKKLIKQ